MSGQRFALFITAIVGAACFAIAALVGVVLLATQHTSRVDCRKWGDATGREVKFVDYGTFSTGICFTKDSTGKWIPIDQVREINA